MRNLIKHGIGGGTVGFLYSAAAVLGLTGFAKIWSSLAPTKILASIDPIFGIAFGDLFLVVGIVELLTASVCLFIKSPRIALGVVAWLSTNFVVYRVGLWWSGWQTPCGCLGNFTEALNLSPAHADVMMRIVLCYLLFGSYGLLYCHWSIRRWFKNES